jgi:hypothetical protein
MTRAHVDAARRLPHRHLRRDHQRAGMGEGSGERRRVLAVGWVGGGGVPVMPSLPQPDQLESVIRERNGRTRQYG